MKITESWDIIAETIDDVLALEKFTRPVDFDRACENTDLCDELGFREPEKYPVFIVIGAQGNMFFLPVDAPKKKRATKTKLASRKHKE